MKTYKRFFCFSISLCIVLALGAINALFMTPKSAWYLGLTLPSLNPDLHSYLWLLFYFVTALTIAEFFVDNHLRKKFFLCLILLVANPLWCFVFFRLHLPILALFILIIILVDLAITCWALARRTKSHWVFSLFLICWYIYLTAVLVTVIFLNR